jgi:hypothetical protein
VEIKRKVEYTFALCAYKLNGAKDSISLDEKNLLWKTQVWLPNKSEYVTIYSSSKYAQSSYMYRFTQLMFGFGRRKKTDFRSILPLMIAASYDLVENSSFQKKIYFHNKFEGYKLVYGTSK